MSYQLSNVNGSTFGHLDITHANYRANYSDKNGQNNFRIRMNFWNYKWKHEESRALYARMRFFFKPAITFADGNQYRMNVIKEDLLRVAFSLHETEVMTIETNLPHGIFSHEASLPMQGLIQTSLTDNNIIAGLLLFFQSTRRMRENIAASATR